jgi:hypothetical protein
MNFGVLAAKNALRNRSRTVMTVLGVAVAILAFILLRTVLWAWTMASENGPDATAFFSASLNAALTVNTLMA